MKHGTYYPLQENLILTQYTIYMDKIIVVIYSKDVGIS